MATNKSSQESSHEFEPRLPEVAEWFHHRRLPYTNFIDYWLSNNAYDTVERLKLIDDFEWRKLLHRSDEPYKIGDFKVFKHSIRTLRNIGFDELHDWSKDNLPDLPASVYGKIGRFLGILTYGKCGEKGVREVYGERSTVRVRDIRSSSHRSSSGDLFNLCVAGGKAIADIIRFDYLNKNEAFLLHAILCHQGKLSKQKKATMIRAWMDVNSSWRERCSAESPLGIVPHLTKVTIDESTYIRIKIKQNSPGVYTYEEYADEEMKKMMKRVDRLTFINNAASRWWGQKVEEELVRRLRNSWKREQIERRGKVDLYFLNETYSLFSDPEMAISLGLVEVLKNMIEKKFIGPNDYITDHWGEKHRLIQFTVEHPPNLRCFEYLMQVPSIDCSLT